MIESVLQLKRRAIPLLLILSIAPLLHAQEPPLEGLDAYVERAMRDWRVPGLALGVVKDDSLVYARGYGVREIGKPGAVDERTLFAVASNTKAFTAALLGMLVEEGKLEWDGRVTDYMSSFRMYDPHVTREINVRDLLTHRSGLPTFGGDHLWIGGSLSRGELVRRLRHLKPTASFRLKYQYQNLMYLAAGQIVPAVTGESWDEAVVKRIFIPLGMTSSNTSVRDLEGSGNVAAPHEIKGGEVVPLAFDNVDCIAPAAAVNSNLIDLSRWIRMNLGGGAFEGRRILAADVLREMHSIQMPIRVSPLREKLLGTQFAGYGLGWGISDYKGRKVIGHGGGLTGMISRQAMVPSEKLGVIVLTNFAHNMLAWALTLRVIDAYLGEPERDWSALYLERKKEEDDEKRKAEVEFGAQRVQNTRPSLDPEEYAGTYFDEFSGKAEVVFENGGLQFRYNPRHIGDLEHWHYDTFQLTWRNPIYDMPPSCLLSFHLDEGGKVEELKVKFYDYFIFEKIEDDEGR